MPDPKQIPYLIRLLDDESETVHKLVLQELASFGASLPHEISRLEPPLDEAERIIVQCMVEEYQLGGRYQALDGIQFIDRRNLFENGQLVSHRRYGYRGVVVNFDLTCQADEEWYMSNSTQPEKNQPWYHILVHQSQHVTYVAQSSLLLDLSRQEIVHPLLKHFFVAFERGKYIRNSRPWPGPIENGRV